jgi:GAF domain-containing protein
VPYGRWNAPLVKRLLRIRVIVIAALTVAAFVLQAAVLRPRLFPAGAGLALSGDRMMGVLAMPVSVPISRPPSVGTLAGRPIHVTDVQTGSPADRAGVRTGQVITAISDAAGHHVVLGRALPDNPQAVLDLWRQVYWLAPAGSLTLDVADAAGSTTRTVALERPPVWSLDGASVVAWLERRHLGPIIEHFAFAFAALLMVVLGARGLTAHLMTVAFFLMGAADSGLLLGAGLAVPIVGPILLVFTWLAMPLAFPAIGMAVLHFPRRAAILDRHPWIVPGLWVVPAPLLAIGLLSSAYLLGLDQAGPLLAWFAAHPWLYSLAFGLGLLVNFLLVLDGVHRYRINPDAAERRRIETVVVTAVPATLAYAIGTGLPVVASAFGWTVRFPWPLAMTLQFITVLSAVGLAYGVAVRRAFSTRTVLRRSLQYALARKTLALVGLLPVVALAIVLVRQRDRPLGAIVGGQPGFYLVCVVLIGLSLRYREAVERWLDRKFFRNEYDAREILVSLASRIPYEADPDALVALVQHEMAAALHPEATAVLVEGHHGYETVSSDGPRPSTLAADSALIQLLRWSDQPLEIFLDDERSPAARLPAPDREWLASIHAAVLVPIVAGSGERRPLVGFIVLGRKRSEEPYTAEDRQLLGAIAAQMGVALDLSRLRRLISQTPQSPERAAAVPTVVSTPAPGAVVVGQTVDGKYRIDELIGRGGMGAVFRARDLRLERDVAIKIVRAELVAAPEARERFRREAQMAARLQHPSIVTVFDYGALPDGTAYLVMEYVRGEDLRGRLTRLGAITPSECATLVIGIASGIEAAHREGILHRDLKPENILLPETGSGPKVLDFGVAKATAVAVGATDTATPTLTSAGTVVGTPAYMAPEQLRGEALDGRADVYSMGVMTYEALTGRLPYGTGSFIDVAMRQADVEKVVDTSNLTPAVASVLLRALAYARDERPPTPSAFADAMTSALRQ